MAPFNTHFLVAEKIWPKLDGPWRSHYGQFCFGCVAPDVDKVSLTLTQKETHFFDRTTAWKLMSSHRSAAFLQSQDRFLHAPFHQLPADAQAFVLGYLCHLCVDEVSKYMWGRKIWGQLKKIDSGAIFAAVDEVARNQIQDYPDIVQSLGVVTVIDVIVPIPLADLVRFLTGAQNFVCANTVEDEFLSLIDLFNHLTPAKRRQRQQTFEKNINIARQRINIFNLNVMIEAAVVRSRQRVADLIAGRVPNPGYPGTKQF